MDERDRAADRPLRARGDRLRAADRAPAVRVRQPDGRPLLPRPQAAAAAAALAAARGPRVGRVAAGEGARRPAAVGRRGVAGAGGDRRLGAGPVLAPRGGDHDPDRRPRRAARRGRGAHHDRRGDRAGARADAAAPAAAEAAEPAAAARAGAGRARPARGRRGRARRARSAATSRRRRTRPRATPRGGRCPTTSTATAGSSWWPPSCVRARAARTCPAAS